jgi:hypothetical protein
MLMIPASILTMSFISIEQIEIGTHCNNKLLGKPLSEKLHQNKQSKACARGSNCPDSGTT